MIIRFICGLLPVLFSVSCGKTSSFYTSAVGGGASSSDAKVESSSKPDHEDPAKEKTDLTSTDGGEKKPTLDSGQGVDVLVDSLETAEESSALAEESGSSTAQEQPLEAQVVGENGVKADNLAFNCSEAEADKSLDNVVELSSQGTDGIELKEDSVVILKISGQADVHLSSAQTARIRGLCIITTGDAQATIGIDFSVQEMTYFGRGNAFSHLEFAESGRFDKISVDISGLHKLSVTGRSVDCGKLESAISGNGNLSCSN